MTQNKIVRINVNKFNNSPDNLKFLVISLRNVSIGIYFAFLRAINDQSEIFNLWLMQFSYKLQLNYVQIIQNLAWK